MAREGVFRVAAFFSGGSLKNRVGLLAFLACAVVVLLMAIHSRLGQVQTSLSRLSSSLRNTGVRPGHSTTLSKAGLPPSGPINSSAVTGKTVRETTASAVRPSPHPTGSANEIDRQHQWLHASSPFGRSPHAILISLLDRHAELQREMRSGKRQPKAILGTCPPYVQCGGMGDRLFGIVTLFTAALVTERAFFIEHSKPVPQVDYMQPHHVDWRLSTVESPAFKQQLRDCVDLKICKLHNLQTKISISVNSSDVLRIVKTANPVLLMISNLRTKSVLNMLIEHNILPDAKTPGWNRKNATQLQVWASYASHVMLRHLFEFAPSVVEKGRLVLRQSWLPVDFHSKITKECLLCVHVRSGQSTHEGLHRYQNLALFGECAHKVEQRMAKTCARNVTWLVVSDHTGAPEIVGGRYAKALSTNDVGPVIHVDHVGVGEHHRSGAMRMYVDFFVLTRCKYFVASLSTFSEMASMWHGLSVQRYEIGLDQSCPSKPRSIYDWQIDVNVVMYKKTGHL